MVMVSFRTAVLFNGPFSSNFIFLGLQCCKRWGHPTLRYSPHGNCWLVCIQHILSQPDIKREAPTQQHHVGFLAGDILNGRCTALSTPPPRPLPPLPSLERGLHGVDSGAGRKISHMSCINSMSGVHPVNSVLFC